MRRSEMCALVASADDEYAKGYIEGLSAYAWFKDGTEYVGTTGSTLTEAIAAFLKERGYGVAA